jgi:sialate O-acetylesterase
MKKIYLLIAFFNLTIAGFSQVKPASIFGDHMVLQRNKPIRIWGEASAGENITVSLSGKSAKVKAGKDGNWQLSLPAMTHGGPYTLSIKGKNEIVYNDVLIGEVWLCSGQSNMEWIVKNSDNATNEITNANFPLIRHITVPKATSLTPVKNIRSASWEICSPASVSNFTAVGYFFAREIYQQLNIPIGLINSSWGGTHVETWISSDAFFGDPEFASLKSKMPENTDKLIAEKKVKIDDLIQKAQPGLPRQDEVNQFSSIGHDDSQWKKMKIPVSWENAGYPNMDGEIWFRKNFSIPADISTADARLELGMIDDIDSTFLNGVFIGSSGVYNEKRVYKIPSGLLKMKNVISVKVIDNGGGGGLYGGGETMALYSGKIAIPLSGEWSFRIEKVYNDANSINPNAYPTLLYNAMINPLVGYGIAGALWYQGESNAGRADQYNTSFPLMINDWRNRWKDSFPFYFVQLTHWQAGGGTSQNGGSTWAELREAQQHTLRLSNTGMAVITDIGNTLDIHPRNKQDVGKRLALQALAKTYGIETKALSPAYSTMSVKDGKVVLTFNNIYSGLVVKNKYGYINGFEIAGSDQQFHYAKAWMENGNVVVFSEKVSQPVAVRYCWSDDPNDVNLFNSEGLPAAPFRTDNWSMKTKGVKFQFE